MAVMLVAKQFKSGDAISKIETFYHAEFLEEVNRAINRREIANPMGQQFEEFFDGERVRFRFHQFEDGAARTGHFACLSPQASGEILFMRRPVHLMSRFWAFAEFFLSLR